jgi:putative flavoprotein involved in K+ transport
VWAPPHEREELDYRAAGIRSIVWCIGFRTDYSWLDLPVFNGRGQPSHVRGVTPVPGIYFIGLPWLYTWGSGRFSGVSRDAEYLAEHIEARVGLTGAERQDALAQSALNEAAIGS